MLDSNVNAGLLMLSTFVLSCFFAGEAASTRIKNLCEIQGARGNALKGIGIIVGLAGTGDKAADALRAPAEMLRRMGVQVGRRDALAAKTVASVHVAAVTFQLLRARRVVRCVRSPDAQVRAMPRQALREAQPDTRVAAGHERDFSAKVE